jgi:hypothetical protein
MWKAALTLIAGLMMFSGTALAASSKPSFSQADTNGDGKVSIKEAIKAGISKQSAEVNDLNNDNMLTKNDWKFVTVKPSSKNSGGMNTSGGGMNSSSGSSSSSSPY